MEDVKPDVTITIDVNSSGLKSDPNGGDHIKNFVVLTDTLGDSDDKPGDPTTFDTIVHSNAKILWKAQSNDGIDTIHIYEIFVNTGQENPFSDPPGELTNGSGDFYAVAKDVDNTKEIESEYSIRFYINGDDKDKYTLDPKLQIRRSIS